MGVAVRSGEAEGARPDRLSGRCAVPVGGWVRVSSGIGFGAVTSEMGTADAELAPVASSAELGAPAGVYATS